MDEEAPQVVDGHRVEHHGVGMDLPAPSTAMVPGIQRRRGPSRRRARLPGRGQREAANTRAAATLRWFRGVSGVSATELGRALGRNRAQSSKPGIAEKVGESVDLFWHGRTGGPASHERTSRRRRHVERVIGGAAEDDPALLPALRRRVCSNCAGHRRECRVGAIAPFWEDKGLGVGQDLLGVGQVRLDQPGEQLDPWTLADGAAHEKGTHQVV